MKRILNLFVLLTVAIGCHKRQNTHDDLVHEKIEVNKTSETKQEQPKPTFNNSIIPEKLLCFIDSTYKLPDTKNYEECYFIGYQQNSRELPYYCEGYFNDDTIKDYALAVINENSEQLIYSFHSNNDSFTPFLIGKRVLRKIIDEQKRNIIDLSIQTETEMRLEAIDTILNLMLYLLRICIILARVFMYGIQKVMNMKNYYSIKTSLFLFILLYSHQLFAQDYFRGSIEYQMSFEIQDSNFLTEKQLKHDYGKGTTFFYQDGNYLQIYNNSSFIEFDFLDSEAKKYYVKYPNNDTLFVHNAAINKDESILNSNNSISNREILDYKCYGFDITVQNKLHGVEYQLCLLFTKQIKIDSKHFKGLKRGFVDTVYESIKSIPLEMRIITPMFTTISTAIKINEEKNVPLEKMFKERTKGLVIKEVNL